MSSSQGKSAQKYFSSIYIFCIVPDAFDMKSTGLQGVGSVLRIPFGLPLKRFKSAEGMGKGT